MTQLGELVGEYLRATVGDELDQLTDPSLSDQEFERIALYLLKFGRLPSADTLSLDEKLKQPWIGDVVHFEETTFVDTEKEGTTWDWLNTYFRLDNWVTGMSGGLLSIPRMLGLTCVLAVGSLPFVLKNDDNRVARAFQSGRFPEAHQLTSLTAKPADATPNQDKVPKSPPKDAPPVASETQPAAAETQKVVVEEPPPAEFDEVLLDLPIKMIKRQDYDQALEQLTQLTRQASAAGKSSLPQLIMVETLIRKGDEHSRELAWKTLVEQDAEETKLYRHLLAARFLLESSAGERTRILAAAPSTSFGKRAYLWVQIRHGIAEENRIKLGDAGDAPDDFLNNICDVLFGACAHIGSKEHSLALNKFKYVKNRLESLGTVHTSDVTLWLLESSKERLILKINETIAKLQASITNSADGSI